MGSELILCYAEIEFPERACYQPGEAFLREANRGEPSRDKLAKKRKKDFIVVVVCFFMFRPHKLGLCH